MLSYDFLYLPDDFQDLETAHRSVDISMTSGVNLTGNHGRAVSVPLHMLAARRVSAAVVFILRILSLSYQ